MDSGGCQTRPIAPTGLRPLWGGQASREGRHHGQAAPCMVLDANGTGRGDDHQSLPQLRGFPRRGESPVPFGKTTHGTEVNSCLHFDYWYIGTGIEKFQQFSQTLINTGSTVGSLRNDDDQSTRAGGNSGRDQTRPVDDKKYIFVMKEDITGFVVLEPASAANAENAAAGLQRWCTTLGVPSVLMSDTVKPLILRTTY